MPTTRLTATAAQLATGCESHRSPGPNLAKARVASPGECPECKSSGRPDRVRIAPGFGSIPGIRTPIVVDGKQMASPNPAPRLGEHSTEILKGNRRGLNQFLPIGSLARIPARAKLGAVWADTLLGLDMKNVNYPRGDPGRRMRDIDCGRSDGCCQKETEAAAFEHRCNQVDLPEADRRDTSGRILLHARRRRNRATAGLLQLSRRSHDEQALTQDRYQESGR